VKFWDTSAIVPLLVNEPSTRTVRALLDEDASVLVWWATRAECISALHRQIREGSLNLEDERKARQALQHLASAWSEVQPTEALRSTAERLLAVHPLRAADAFQLAAALQWCRQQPTNRTVVSFDARLRDAAYKEGFTIVPSKLG
jgi:predicted nucleic acid-binding protein